MTATISLKRTVLTDLYRLNVHTLWLRVLSTNGSLLHKFYRYAKTFSILKYNFRSIHFFVIQIAMFVYEMPLSLRGFRVRDFWPWLHFVAYHVDMRNSSAPYLCTQFTLARRAAQRNLSDRRSTFKISAVISNVWTEALSGMVWLSYQLNNYPV